MGLAETVLVTGSVDVTPDTASLGLISTSNNSKEAEAATKSEVSSTGNKYTLDEKKKTSQESSPCTNVAKIVEDKKHASTNALIDKAQETAVASFGAKSLITTLPVIEGRSSTYIASDQKRPRETTGKSKVTGV